MELDKNKIKRGDLKTNDLKMIIVRIDFVGVSNIDDYIKSLIRGPFANQRAANYVRGVRSFDKNDDIERIANLLEVAKTEIMNTTIHRFSEIKDFLPNIATIDISEYSIVLSVECKEYEGFDGYRQFLSEIWEKLTGKNPYLSVKRLGVRKICSFLSTQAKDLREKVEIKTLPDPIVVETAPDCTYVDSFYWKDYFINCTLKRELATGWIKNDEKRLEAFQFSLDYDLYLNRGLIEEQIKWECLKKDKDINSALNNINDLHFFLFKESITKEYLNFLCNG